jgi:hypothetical protein
MWQIRSQLARHVGSALCKDLVEEPTFDVFYLYSLPAQKKPFKKPAEWRGQDHQTENGQASPMEKVNRNQSDERISNP